MFKQAVSAKTASADTTKTLVDTMTVPAGATKIVGVAALCIGSGTLTSGESVSGIIELESDDASIVPAQFLLDAVQCLTSGVCSLKPTQWPAAIPVKGGDRIKVYVTMDMAQTTNFTCRAQLTFN